MHFLFKMICSLSLSLSLSPSSVSLRRRKYPAKSEQLEVNGSVRLLFSTGNINRLVTARVSRRVYALQSKRYR
jgi:hypothetical protein